MRKKWGKWTGMRPPSKRKEAKNRGVGGSIQTKGRPRGNSTSGGKHADEAFNRKGSLIEKSEKSNQLVRKVRRPEEKRSPSSTQKPKK